MIRQKKIDSRPNVNNELKDILNKAIDIRREAYSDDESISSESQSENDDDEWD